MKHWTDFLFALAYHLITLLNVWVNKQYFIANPYEGSFDIMGSQHTQCQLYLIWTFHICQIKQGNCPAKWVTHFDSFTILATMGTPIVVCRTSQNWITFDKYTKIIFVCICYCMFVHTNLMKVTNFVHRSTELCRVS